MRPEPTGSSCSGHKAAGISRVKKRKGMTIFIGILVIGIIALIVVLFFLPETEDRRKKYLNKFSQLVEGNLETIEGSDNSYRVRFRYQGNDFIYEDIEEEEFRQRKYHQGYLKAPTGTDLVLSFMEKERSTIVETGAARARSNALTSRKLKAFEIYSNNQMLAEALMADDEVVDIFAAFKNVDHRGHPFMAMEILEGCLVLRFYSTEGFKPSLFSLQNNVSAVEGFLDRMVKVIRKVQRIREEKGLNT